MSASVDEFEIDAQALAYAQELLRGGALPGLFAVLAGRKTGKAERRAAAAALAGQFVPLGVALHLRAFTRDEAVQLERGLWNAALAAPMNSRTEGLNAVLWERALGNVYAADPKAAVAALRADAMDQKLKKRSVPAKLLAANLNFMGMIWRPENWGGSPQGATRSFNRTAKWLGQKLHPASPAVADLHQRSAELARWRRAVTQAAHRS